MATIARSQAAGFTDYGAEAEDIARRRKMAEMMQMQALEPIKQETAGGYVVPISWTQGLAKALQAGVGGYQQGQLNREARELATRYTNERSNVLNDAMRAGMGTPEQPSLVPGDPGVPAKPGSQLDTYRRLAGSQFPDLQAAGTAGMLDDMRRQRLAQLLGTAGTGSPGQQGQGASGGAVPNIPPGMNPLAWKLLVDSGDEKAMAAAIAEAAKPTNRFLAGREGPIFDVSGTSPQVVAINPKVDPGMMPTYGPNSQLIGAQAIPGYAQGRAGIRAAETTAVEGAKAGFDIVKVPDGRGGTIDMPRSQLVQLLQPQQAGSGIVRGEAPNDAEALRQAIELNDQGRQFSISTPPTSGAVQPQQPRLGYSNPAAESAQKQTGLNDANRVRDFEEKIPVLANINKRLERLRDLTADDKTYASAGAEVKVLMNRIGQAFGVNVDPTKTANSEEYLAQVGELLKERLGSKDYGSGNGISNLDLISASVPLPTLVKTARGRQQIIDAIMQDTQNALANSKAASSYFRQNGSLSGFEFPSEANPRKYGQPAWDESKERRLQELKKKLGTGQGG